MVTRRKMLHLSSATAMLPFCKRIGFAQELQTNHDVRLKNPFDYVNAEFRPVLEAISPTLMKADTPFSAATLAQHRSAGIHDYSPASPKPPVVEHIVTGKGDVGVKVFVVGSEPGASKPAVLHIHGGGFVSGSDSINQGLLQQLATDCSCVVVGVEYRLAPETRFPGSLEDNYAALRWMHTNAKELGVDVTRVAVKGESAGGGHAAMLAIAARDRKEFSFCQQVLIYPMLDDRTGSTRPVPAYIGHFVWTPEANRFGWTSLLGVPAGSANIPANSVPARVTNLDGLPPTFIGVGSIDLFAAENLEFSRRLLESGVETELLLVPGAFHAFDLICAQAPLAIAFNLAWTRALRKAFKLS